MQIALILSYLLLVHLSVITKSPYVQAVALVALAAAVLYQGLKKLNPLSWAFFVGLIVLMLLITYFGFAQYVIYLPPIVIPILVAAVFIQTLLPGKTPLVTDIGERSRGPLTASMRSYTRAVTVMWSVVLVAMALWSVVLIFIDSPMLWSIFTNFLNYAIVALLFVGEFIYRQWRFKNHNHPTLRDYLRIVTNAKHFRRH